MVAEVIELKVLDPDILLYGIPSRESLGAAGYDLRACIKESIIVPSETTVKFPTGIAIYIKDIHTAALVFPRSGLAHKFSITLQNAVGLIDSDYQGEIQVLLRNEGSEPYKVNPGDRIAQLVFTPVFHPMVSIVQSFVSSDRGAGGFGSTGYSSDTRTADPELRPEGFATPGQLLGNELPIETGLELETVIKYEPTGFESLEAEYGE
jgi:dUTP pyrophosphatase